MPAAGLLRQSVSRNEPDDDLRPEAWLTSVAVDALSAHPALPDAVAGLLQSLIDNYASNRLLNQVLSDRGRVMVGLYVCFLALHPRPGDEGVTQSAVQALCRQTGLCSPGRVAALMALMRFGGFIVSEIDPADRRKRRLMPAPKLLDEHRRRWTSNYDAMRAVLPGAAPVLSQIGTEHFRNALLTELGAHYLAGFRPLAYAPALASVADSNAGLLIVAGIMLRQRRRTECSQSGPIPVSISAVARRFSVARAHVRNVLAQAEAAGLLVRSANGAGVVALPALGASIHHFFAALFLLFDRCGARALVASGSTSRVTDPAA